MIPPQVSGGGLPGNSVSEIRSALPQTGSSASSPPAFLEAMGQALSDRRLSSNLLPGNTAASGSGSVDVTTDDQVAGEPGFPTPGVLESCQPLLGSRRRSSLVLEACGESSGLDPASTSPVQPNPGVLLLEPVLSRAETRCPADSEADGRVEENQKPAADDLFDPPDNSLALSSACALLLQPAWPTPPQEKILLVQSNPTLAQEGTSMPGQFVPTEKEAQPGGPVSDAQAHSPNPALEAKTPPINLLKSSLIPVSCNEKVNSEAVPAPSEKSSSALAPVCHGTTDAPRQEIMRPEAKMNQAPSGNEQSLPPVAPVEQPSSPGPDLPSRETPAPVMAGAPEAPPSPRTGVAHSESSTATPVISATERVEAISEMVLHQTVELKRLRADSMEVVLRPDHETEIHLQVTQEKGLILVSARCEKGDWESLSAHWGELQQSLGAQGVQVGRLETFLPAATSSAPSGFGASRQHQQQPSSGREQDHPALAKTPAASEAAPAPKRPWENTTGPVLPGWLKRWESWA